jgi:hypothetical protein
MGLKDFILLLPDGFPTLYLLIDPTNSIQLFDRTTSTEQ